MFSDAIGGCLLIDRVCKQCNSTLGSRVDAALTDSLLVSNRRADLGLAGAGGQPPAIYEMLLGKATLAGHPEVEVINRYDEATGRIDTRLIAKVDNFVMADGTKAARISVDERERHRLPLLIQRALKRHGLPPATPDELAAYVSQVVSRTIIDNPKLNLQRSYDFSFVRHAMTKIAYELAFLWLGEQYLDDPLGGRLRTSICAEHPDSTDRLPADISESVMSIFDMWSKNETHHLAFMIVEDNSVAIAIRVFNVHAAVVWVTNHAQQYLSHEYAGVPIRFLAIDPVRRTMLDNRVEDGWQKMTLAMMATMQG